MLTEPILLNFPTLASIAPYMAFPCFHEVCLHLLMLLGFANFNILTLILIGLRIYMQHGQSCTGQQNSEIGYGQTDERMEKLSDAVTS